MSFRLGSIPVHVRGTFLFIALLIASAYREARLVGIAAAVVFVSILVHELGHAFVGKAFGLAPQIELHGMGGTTSWMSGRNVGHARGMAISVAGPVAGFALAVAIAIHLGVRDPWSFFRAPMPSDPRAFGEAFAFRVNCWWGFLNLLPMLPLDGGNVMRSGLMLLTKNRGEKPARVISAGVAGLSLLYSVVVQDMWWGLFSAMFVWSNVQAFRQADQRAIDLPLAQAIEKAYAALDKQDGAEAVALLKPALVPNAAPELRQLGLRLYAYGLLLQGSWAELMPLLERERNVLGAEELERYSKTARELGRTSEAERIDALRAALA